MNNINWAPKILLKEEYERIKDKVSEKKLSINQRLIVFWGEQLLFDQGKLLDNAC